MYNTERTLNYGLQPLSSIIIVWINMLARLHVVKTFLLSKNNRYNDIPTLDRVIQNTDINSEQNYNQMCYKEYLTISCYISVYI